MIFIGRKTCPCGQEAHFYLPLSSLVANWGLIQAPQIKEDVIEAIFQLELGNRLEPEIARAKARIEGEGGVFLMPDQDGLRCPSCKRTLPLEEFQYANAEALWADKISDN